MRGLRAALGKDLRLFAGGMGVFSLVLPLLLLAALRLGMGDLTAQSYVQSFPIAVRDLDGTIMSRSLLSQMGRLELFSEVWDLEEDDEDADALERGAAAVVTVPKDFFYDLYSMKPCPVYASLNEDMPLESTLFRAIFSSVMDIIRSDQASGRGLYRFCYGELTPELQQQLYSEASAYLIQDALGRQLVFSGQVQISDLQGALERRLLASVLSVLALFFALSAVKTLPEELRLGVLPRYRAAGGSTAAFVLSKLLLALLLTLPTLVLILLVLPPEGGWRTAVVSAILTLGAFGVLLGLSAWLGSPAAVQRWGNLILLLSLALGGTLWTRLPGLLGTIGRYTLPGYALLALEALSRGARMSEILGLLWPVLAAGGVGTVFAALALGRSRRNAAAPVRPSSSVPEPPAPAALRGAPARLAGLSELKLRAMSGGLPGLAAMLAVALICGLAAGSARSGASQLRLGVCDLDDSALSQELVEFLTGQEGLETALYTPEQGLRAVLLGDAEGLLTIPQGYENALRQGEQPQLDYQSAASAVTAQGAREIVAGQVAVQTSQQRAILQAGERLGRALTDEEEQQLTGLIAQELAQAPAAFEIETLSGAPVSPPFLPGSMSFAALVALLLCLTAAGWCAGPDGRHVEQRMFSLPGGGVLSWGSSCAALTALGFALCLAVLLPGGDCSAVPLLAALGYSFCVAALALVLARLSAQEGRVDGLAPFLALILCLLGGCFLDFTQLSPTLGTLSLLAPPGLAVRAAQGSLPCLAALAAEGTILFLAGMPRRQ